MNMLKHLKKSGALFALLIAATAVQANETHQMYGIRGDNLTLTTSIADPQSYKVNGKIYTTQGEESKSYTKEGMASYYHSKFNGRRTASGDRYNSSEFTAAHKTLPLGSYAVVTNLDNNRKVIVRINDRGPFSNKRLIDLSGAAAREIGLISSGTGQVRIEALHVDRRGKISGAGTKTLAKHAKTQEAAERLATNEKKNPQLNSDSTKNQKNLYALKVINLSSKSQAEQLITQLDLDGIKSNVSANGGRYDIHLGPLNDQADVQQLKRQLQKIGNDKPLIVYTYKTNSQ